MEIAAVRTAVESGQPRARLVFEERELVVALREAQRETGLARAFREGEWVVSIQLDPPLGSNVQGLIEVSLALEDSVASGLSTSTTTRRRARDELADGLGEDRTRVRARDDPHLTTRDWSVLGLESMLLGAHAEGVRNVLAITGDPPEVGDYPGSRGVYEVDAIGLTRLVSQLNRGEDFNGRPIDAPTSFFVGVAVNPTADDLELEVERFRRKVEEGARFAMTQIVYDFEAYDAFVDRLGGSWPIPVLAGILPLTSHRFALRLHNEVPGIVVPQELQDASRRPARTRPTSASRMRVD